jgi:hypothetical protein
VTEFEEEVRQLMPREQQHSCWSRFKRMTKCQATFRANAKLPPVASVALLSGWRLKKGVLPLLQDEIDRFTAKMETLEKAEDLEGHAGAAREGCGCDEGGRRLSSGR